MNSRHRSRIGGALVALGLFATASAQAKPTYRYQEVTDGGVPFVVSGYNNKGQLTGSTSKGAAAVWSGGAVAYYPQCGSLVAINDRGRAVGVVPDRHGYCWVETADGTVHTQGIDGFDGVVSVFHINNSNVAVGYLEFQHKATVGLLLTGHTVVQYQAEDASIGRDGGSYPMLIADDGLFVGWLKKGNSHRGFASRLGEGDQSEVFGPAGLMPLCEIDQHSSATVGGYYPNPKTGQNVAFVFDFFGLHNAVAPAKAVTSEVISFRPNHEYAGNYSSVAGGPLFGFVHHIARYKPFQTIRYPGSVQTVLVGLTKDGAIVGNYTTDDGVVHGFVALPSAGG